MAIETKRIDDPNIPLATDLNDVTIPVMQGGVSKRLMANQLVMHGTAYGIRIDTAISNPVVQRIGNGLLHQALPIQSKMRRCVLNVDGTVKYYLNENNSLLKENGTTANLDGTDGDVMVEIPEFYYRVDQVSATASEVWISETELPGFSKFSKRYVSAFEAVTDSVENKLCSVMSTAVRYRGGNNNAAYDGTYRSFLGVPTTATSRINFTTQARNKGAYGRNGAGWNQFTYDCWRAICMLYYVEYANLNSQSAFNSAPDANGYKQGGLGDGVTTLVSADWSAYNGSYPFVPCGHTVSLGNNTGVVPFTMPVEYDAGQQPVLDVPSYRGIENPFGHIYKWLEGVNVRIQSDADGGRSTVFATDNPSLFNHTNYTGFREVGDIYRTNSYIKEVIMGKYFDLVGKVGGGGSTTYWGDMGYYGSIPSTGESLRALILGGNAANGANSGLVFTTSSTAPSTTTAIIGARLCFIP